jgi:transposase
MDAAKSFFARAADISGLTGMAIIQAILNGERDRYSLADLAHARIHATRDEIARSQSGLPGDR